MTNPIENIDHEAQAELISTVLTEDVKTPTREDIIALIEGLTEQKEKFDSVSNNLVVVIEGPDHIGKSTLIDNLTAKLTTAGRKVKCFREPGSSVVGEGCRSLLKSTPNLSSDTEFLLFHAARTVMMEEISTYLQTPETESTIILLDRSIISSIVYQAIVGKSQLAEMICTQVAQQTAHLTLWLLPEEAEYLEHLKNTNYSAEDAIDSKYPPQNIHTGYSYLWDQAVVGGNVESEMAIGMTDTKWSATNARIRTLENEPRIDEALTHILGLEEAYANELELARATIQQELDTAEKLLKELPQE